MADQDVLREQVKKLVRTERRLYRLQLELEEQLERVNTLHRFALDTSGLLDVIQLLGAGARLLTEVLALDQCVGFAVDDDAGMLVPQVTHAVEGLQAQLQPSACTPSAVPVGTGNAIARPLIVNEAGDPPENTSAVEPFMQATRSLFDSPDRGAGVDHLYAIAPLRDAKQQLRGLLVARRALDSFGGHERLPAERDVAFIELLGNSLARALEKAALLGQLIERTAEKAQLERELELARSIQSALLPAERVHAIGGIEIAAAFVPATQCSGDWWTYRQVGDRVVCLVGDVTGHGLAAAMITASVKTAFDLLVADSAAPLRCSTLLQKMNEVVRSAGKGQYFMTCFVAVIEPRERQISFGNAGHNFPYLCSPQRGGSLDSLALTGHVLGFTECEFADKVQPYCPGDVIYLYSDGLTECENAAEEAYGERRLRKAIQRFSSLPPAEVVERIASEQAMFLQGTPRADDMTLVVIRVP
jgi:serine phosphatase RsbU (regulator of sigma subunit)